MRLIVGLGNPGAEYARTRHNIGFAVAEALAERWGARWRDRGTKFQAWTAEARVRDEPVVLARPQTYMNRSGQAVQGLVAYYGIDPEGLLVVVDDLDLPLGRLRLRRAGGSGGHRGLEDVIRCLGTSEFARLRCGIGRRGEAVAHVLSAFSPEEEPVRDEMIARAVSAVETWLAEGIDAAMNRFNASPGDGPTTAPGQE